MTTSGVPRFLAISGDIDRLLDLEASVGQRVSTFRYELLNGLTGIRIGDVHPLRSTIPVLVHNTQNTIMRTLTGVNFGVDDTAQMNPLTDRIRVFMMINLPDGTQEEFPLGRYMYDSFTRQTTTGGDLSQNGLFDEMFIIDQAMTSGFSCIAHEQVEDAIKRLLAPLVDAGLIRIQLAGSGIVAGGSWPSGTSRAQVLSDLCKQGGYFQPWFDNDGIMQAILSFNPADVLPTYDFDLSQVVYRNTISYTNDFLDAPNQYVVVNNSGTTTSASSVGSVGIYNVPSAAPWSAQNRGFVIPKQIELQASADGSVQGIANTIAQQSIVFERVQLSTAPDPRHDSYDVIRWQDQQWMEISWSMQLQEGAPTLRTIRKAYA